MSVLNTVCETKGKKGCWSFSPAYTDLCSCVSAQHLSIGLITIRNTYGSINLPQDQLPHNSDTNTSHNTNINPLNKEDTAYHICRLTMFFKVKLQNVELAENNVHWHWTHAVRPVTFKYMGREVVLTLAASPRSQSKLVLEK